MNNVLIIDDDKELCTLMKKCVEQEGLTATIANNGSAGLNSVMDIPCGYALVILDIMMPDIDGFQVLQKIREISNRPLAKSKEI